MAAAQKVVTAVRSSRSNYGLTVREKAALMLACNDSALAADLAELAPEIATLSSSSSARVLQVLRNDLLTFVHSRCQPALRCFRGIAKHVMLEWVADR